MAQEILAYWEQVVPGCSDMPIYNGLANTLASLDLLVAEQLQSVQLNNLPVYLPVYNLEEHVSDSGCERKWFYRYQYGVDDKFAEELVDFDVETHEIEPVAEQLAEEMRNFESEPEDSPGWDSEAYKAWKTERLNKHLREYTNTSPDRLVSMEGELPAAPKPDPYELEKIGWKCHNQGCPDRSPRSAPEICYTCGQRMVAVAT